MSGKIKFPIKSLFLSFFLAELCHAGNTTPPTLCKPEELIITTCGFIGQNKKIFSICGFKKSTNDDLSYVAYRFGKKSKIELSHVVTKKSLENTPIYRGTDYNFNVNFWFTTNNTTYTVIVPQQTLGARVEILVEQIADGKTATSSSMYCMPGLGYWDGGKNKNIKTDLFKSP